MCVVIFGTAGESFGVDILCGFLANVYKFLKFTFTLYVNAFSLTNVIFCNIRASENVDVSSAKFEIFFHKHGENFSYLVPLCVPLVITKAIRVFK